MNSEPDILIVVFALLAIGFVPLVALVATSYLKIVVVLGLVRNAIGVQQVPPNMVLSAIALILSAYIMAPVANAAYQSLTTDRVLTKRLTPTTITQLADGIQQPLARFLSRHTTEKDRAFFVSSAKSLWAHEESLEVGADSLLILVPAFTVRELTRAFHIGFVLYLAFIAIDLIVATLTQAFGLTMLSPTPVAIPFKLLLFVGLDGWQRLIYALVLGYA